MTVIDVEKGDLSTYEADAVVVNLFKGTKRPAGATAGLEKALDGAISHRIELGDFKGGDGEIVVLHTNGAIKAPRVLVVGLGERKGFNAERIRETSATVCRAARSKGWKRIATVLHGAGIGSIKADVASQAIAEGALLGLYEFKETKSTPTDPDEKEEHEKELTSCTIVEADARKLPAIRKGLRRGRILAEATNLARTLINRPSIDKPPATMAKIAVAEAKKAGFKAEVFGPKELKQMGMGLILGVGSGAGAGREPCLVVMDYKGRGKKTVALVGKGITFDSGGINLKPSKGMEQMKYDMAGSACVLATMVAAANLKVPNRVIGLMALAENMPSGSAIRPGDVLTGHDGTKVEIGNTDAEGRLVLGDAIAYVVKKHDPDVILDAATLTGAVKVALGDITTGIMGNDNALVRSLIAAGKVTGDDVWQLPLHAGYEKQIKSRVADIANIGPGWGGTITAAAFLKHFVGKRAKWAHLDIAGTTWTDGGPSELKKAYLPRGATGVPVRLFVQYLSTLR